MKKLNLFIKKLNIKKIAMIMLIVMIAAGIACTTVTLFIYGDRLSFAIKYAQLKSEFEQSGSFDANRLNKLDEIAAGSSDIVDILAVDADNNVIYSARNTAFGQSKQFNLSADSEDKNYLVCKADSNVVFYPVKGKDFLLSAVFDINSENINEEYDNSNFYSNHFNNKEVYMLNYAVNKTTGGRIYFIRNTETVKNGNYVLKIDAAAAMLFFMLYWVLLALWVYKKAIESKMNAIYWGIAVLFTNIAGLLVFVLYRHSNSICASCGACQSKANSYCSFCGEKLHDNCKKCGESINENDDFCTHCGNKIK